MCVINAKNPIKYPKTLHIPSSPGVMSDDKVLKNISCLKGKTFIISEKRDGENTTLYSDGLHARSVNYKHNFTRDLIRAYHSEIAHMIPDGWRICGENLTYKHSIKYNNLSHFFEVFSVWNHLNECLSWDDTLEFCQQRSIHTVPTLCHALGNIHSIDFNIQHHRKLMGSVINPTEMEGYVIRNKESFHYNDFDKNVFKWVRANHVQTDEHWLKNTEKNGCLA